MGLAVMSPDGGAARVSVFAEYNYAWFDDNRTCFVVGGCTPPSLSINQKLQTVLVGVSWRFNFGGPAVVAKY